MRVTILVSNLGRASTRLYVNDYDYGKHGSRDRTIPRYPRRNRQELCFVFIGTCTSQTDVLCTRRGKVGVVWIMDPIVKHAVRFLLQNRIMGLDSGSS
jgi:hypothetical protein